MSDPAGRAVNIRYTNYRGETAWRTVLPLRIFWGRNEWHPEDQWLMDAFDADKDTERTFALQHIHEWRPFNG